MANHGFDRDNAVNAGPIKGLEIEQADGRGDLDAGRNRGDAGDPYPGTTGNTAISYNTNPAAVKNSDASFVGFAVDSIEQLVPNGAMRLRLQFGQPLSFAATVHGAITANPATTSGSFLAESSSVTLTAATDAGYVFAGWSGDTLTANTALALSMTHPYTLTANFGTPLAITTSDTLPGAVMGATYTDTLRASGGTGSFSWQAVGQLPPSLALSANGVLSGTVTRSGTFSVQARVTSVTLQQTHTFTLVATVPALGTPAVVAQILTGTSTLTPANLVYLDLIGNQDGQFDVGDFLAWVDSTGAPAASPPRTPVSTAARASTKGRSR